MKNNFKDSLKFTLSQEGGWSDHPADPGGATMKGVTLKTYSEYLGRPASKQELRAIPDNHLENIYRKKYWDKVRGDDLPRGMDLCVFDFAVNSGPSRAIKILQALCKAKPDGIIGPATLKAVNDWFIDAAPSISIDEYQHARQHYLEAIPTFSTFGKGWTRRVKEGRDAALALIYGL